MPINTVIVDDERPARDELLYLLKGFPEINIVALGKNGLEVLREIRRHTEYMTMPFVLFTRADPRHKTDNENYGNLMQELDALGAVYLPKTASNLRQFPAIQIVK